MNIYEALKLEDVDIRLTNDEENRWLVWDCSTGRWAVWERKRYQRETGCLYLGDSCDEAVKVLIAKAEECKMKGGASLETIYQTVKILLKKGMPQ